MVFDISVFYPNGPINIIFLSVILLLTIIDLLTYFPKSTHHIDFKSTIISIGVLGTFVGVFIGLLNFDTNDISNSVPPLLKGLQLAFYTSVSGMFFALIITVIQKMNPKYSMLDDDSGLLKNINDKLDSLEKIQRNTEGISLIPVQITTALFEIRDLIIANNKEIVLTLTVEFEKVQTSLDRATESLAKGATEEIIKALEVVISDFNKNLTEQFGDNFKQLNESVVNMIQWQENYKSSIEKLEGKFNEVMSAFESNINNGKAALEDVFDKFKSNSESLMESNKSSQEQIKKYIDDSASSISEASNVISTIKDDFNSIAEMSSRLESVIETNQNQISNLEKHLESMSQVGKDAGEVTNSIRNFSNEIQDSLSSQSKSLSKMTQELDKQLPESLGKLNKSLTSLTKQFAKDYEKFLNLMSKLINTK